METLLNPPFTEPAPSGLWTIKKKVTLTDKLAWTLAASTFEQWGTEFATVLFEDLPNPEDISVSAWVAGSAMNLNETGFLGLYLETSLDAGVSWIGAVGDDENQLRIGTGTNVNNRQMMQNFSFEEGTATDDVRVRAMVRNGIGAASVIDLENGRIMMEVSGQY